MTLATPAAAQVTGTVAVQNDYLMRGYSVSGGEPTATLNLYYDTPAGLYLNASAIGAIGDGTEPQFLGYIGNIGYAARVAPHLSLDAGVQRVQYSRYANRATSRAHYTDIYVGAFGRDLSARLHYSPDYLYAHSSTLYAEVDGGIEVAPKWRVDGHVGVLDYLDVPPCCRYYASFSRAAFDWRAGVSRSFGPVDVYASVSSRASLVRDQDPELTYRRPHHATPAVVVGASWSF